MVRSFLKATVLATMASVLGSVSSFGQSTELQQAVDSAFVYTDVQRFEDALLILSQVSESDKEHYLYSLTRARILTWSRNYPQAQSEFDKLLDEHPDNPDIMVPYAYLQLFDGNLITAEFVFSKVLQNYPDYNDAMIGLQRTQNLKRQKRSIFDSGYQVIENLTD